MRGDKQVSVVSATSGMAGPGSGGPVPAAQSAVRSELGFCRVTIVAPDSRVDVALPDDVPLADLYPEVLRLSAQSPDEGAPVGYHLVRRDGAVLESARSLAAQGVLDGELLSMRPFADSLPPAVYDDVSDAVASAVSRDSTLWNETLTRGAGLVAGGVLPALLAFSLWTTRPRHDMHGLSGILAAVAGILLLILAGVRARVYDDRGSAVALGLGALPNMGVAGSGLLPLAAHHGIGRLQLLLACAAVLIAAVVLTLVSPGGDGPFVAFVFASGVGLLTVFVASLTDWRPVETAALCAPVAVGALAFLPGLSMRFARLPIGYESPHASPGGPGGTSQAFRALGDVDPGLQQPVDAERIAAQARRGHELLVGLVGGCALVSVGACAVLGFSGNLWGQLLALATAIAMFMRARLFRYTAQVTAALAAGLIALLLLGLGLSLNPPVTLIRHALTGDSRGLDIRTLWLAAAIGLAAALTTAVGLIVPNKGVSPFWGRFLEIAEGFVLLTLVPLTLAVFDVFTAARAMTS
jgi:type VII secretion integral membrane protein EccD